MRGILTRALHPREKPVVGWLAGATRAFVLAGRFVGIYPTPVSIFAGAGYLHGSGMSTLQLRKSTYIGKNRSQFSDHVAKIFNVGRFNVHTYNYMVICNQKTNQFQYSFIIIDIDW